MSALERVFHAVLFEVLAISLCILGLVIFTEHSANMLSGTMIVVATVAMLWNGFFNMLVDRFFTAPRESRGFFFRICHVILFEGGLLLITVPLMAWMLSVTLFEAFMLDISVTIFITFYAFVFNFAYDKVRAYIFNRRNIHINVLPH